MIELGKRHRPSNYSRAVAKRAKLQEEWGDSEKAREKKFRERLALLLEADL